MKASVSIMITDDHGKLLNVYRGKTVAKLTDFELQNSFDDARSTFDEAIEENIGHVPHRD